MRSYHHQPSEGNKKWKKLLACTAGRPIDPDAFPEPHKNRPSRKTKRERFVPLKESNKVGVGRNQHGVAYPRELDYVDNPYYNARPDVPISELVLKAVATYSPSRSFDTPLTVTTQSTSTAADSILHRRQSQYSDPYRSKQEYPAANQSTSQPYLTINASPSFGEDVSFLSFHIEDEEAEENELKLQEQNQQLGFWRRRASECFDRYGMEHRETATAFLELGQAHTRFEQYTVAQDFFRTAIRVFEKKFGPNDLRVAKTLESLGMAQSQGNSDCSFGESSSSCGNQSNKAGLLLGLNSFRKCLRIRFDVLGPTHIDTVETLNKIANIYMKLRMYSSAKNDFMEVLTLRTAILGENHPSVAVAAKSLGLAHLQKQEIEQAKAYFLQALNVFAYSGLGDHPMAEQLREDIRSLGFDLSRVEI